MQQVSINPSSGIQNKNFNNKSTKEKLKEKWEEIPEGDKKITAALGALAAIAIAGIASYKGKSTQTAEVITESKPFQQGSEIINEITTKPQEAMQDLGKKTQETVQNLGKKTQETVQNLGKKTQNIAEQAKEDIMQNGDYKTIRKESLKNQTHDDKRIIKDKIKEGIIARKAQQQERTHSLIEQNKTVREMTQQTQQINQGIKSSVSVEELQARKQAAQQASSLARQTADELKGNAKTKKEVKYAKQADTRALQARKNAQKVEANADKRIAQLQQEAQQKARNVEIQKSSPNYQQGLEKQEINAQKTVQNSAKRQYKKEYERAYRKYVNTPKEKLLKTADKNNLTEIEKIAIMDILDKATSV